MLSGREVLEQHIGGEIAFREGIDEAGMQIVRKPSVVDHSTHMRAARSARAQMTPESVDTSPD
jgi:hypothetical protein